jgi:hypothetical protein
MLRYGVIGLSAVTAFCAGAAPRADSPADVQSWRTNRYGVSLRLTQILPDQVRGFYLARGFDVETVEYMATGHCFFQTVLRNESSGGPIRFRLAEWRVRAAGGERPLKLVDEWLAEWQRHGVSEPARTAFRWAQFPPEQEYEPGDWNMGMTTYALPPGSRFDLEAVWWRGNDRRAARLRDLRCARDDGATK